MAGAHIRPHTAESPCRSPSVSCRDEISASWHARRTRGAAVFDDKSDYRDIIVMPELIGGSAHWRHWKALHALNVTSLALETPQDRDPQNQQPSSMSAGVPGTSL